MEGLRDPEIKLAVIRADPATLDMAYSLARGESKLRTGIKITLIGVKTSRNPWKFVTPVGVNINNHLRDPKIGARHHRQTKNDMLTGGHPCLALVGYEVIETILSEIVRIDIGKTVKVRPQWVTKMDEERRPDIRIRVSGLT